MRVNVLGAGVAGLCTATELHARGHDVTVTDRAAQHGPHACSWWAGGMLAPYCEGESAEPAVVTMGKTAADWWAKQGADVQRHGTLVVALGRDRRELARFARRTEGHVPANIPALEPHLADRFVQGLYLQDEAHLDPRTTLIALRQRLTQRGVRFVQGEGTADGATVDCRGLAARDSLPDLRGVKGEMVIIRTPEVTLTRPVRLLHPRYPLYVVPRADSHFMIGATQIESGARTRATVRSVLELLSAAYALHPAFGEAEVVELGADARPAFPDNLPRVIRDGSTVYLNGLFRHGFLLAPAMAAQAADLIEEISHADHA